MQNLSETLKATATTYRLFGKTESQIYNALKATLIKNKVDPTPALPFVVFNEPTMTSEEIAKEYGISLQALHDYFINNLFLTKITVDRSEILSVPNCHCGFGFNSEDGHPLWYRATVGELMIDMEPSFYNY